ncbi:MAG: RHS repeat-associated core domain-containing protein [Planctomycetes bacterium]|nr:RHS repeat-associated core domain-containing protein [Planctomycetota bacterium]
MVSLTDPVGNTTQFAYDGLGRTTMETNALGQSRSYYYDSAETLAKRIDRRGKGIVWDYDDLNRPTAESWYDDASPVASVSITTTQEGGPINEVQRTGFGIGAGMLMGGTFKLALQGDWTGPIAWNAPAADVQTALEGLSGIGSGNVAVTAPQQTSSTREWRLTFQNALAGVNVNQITVDTSGIQKTGHITPIEATDTQGSVNNEIQQVALQNAGGGTFRLAYSGQTTAALSYQATATRFVYDGDHISLEFDGPNAGDLTHRYLHGPVIDQILADEEVTSLGTAGDVVWPLADNQGTIRDLVDETGSVLNHLKYDSFGKMTSETNGAVDFLFAYTGRERDEETGLYYYRARLLDHLTGRFISEDPLGFAAGDANVNRYGGNSIPNVTDPFGLQPPESVMDRRIGLRENGRPDDGAWWRGKPGQPPGGGSWLGRIGNELYWYGNMLIGRRPEFDGKPEPYPWNPIRRAADDIDKIPFVPNPIAPIADISEGDYGSVVGTIGSEIVFRKIDRLIPIDRIIPVHPRLGVTAPSRTMTPGQQALRELVDETTLGGRRPLTTSQAETVLDWADEVGYPGVRAKPGDVADPSNWTGNPVPHIHIPAAGRGGHVPVQPGVRPR